MNGVKGKLGGCDKCDDVWGQEGECSCNVEEITTRQETSPDIAQSVYISCTTYNDTGASGM